MLPPGYQKLKLVLDGLARRRRHELERAQAAAAEAARPAERPVQQLAIEAPTGQLEWK